MHFHRLQTDYWWLADGSIRVGLVDLRPESLTVRQATCLELDSDDPMGTETTGTLSPLFSPVQKKGTQACIRSTRGSQARMRYVTLIYWD